MNAGRALSRDHVRPRRRPARAARIPEEVRHRGRHKLITRAYVRESVDNIASVPGLPGPRSRIYLSACGTRIGALGVSIT